MSIDLSELNNLSKELEQACKELETLKESRSLLDFRGHQKRAFVSVNGVSINVDYMDRSTGYHSTVKRGHEMIVLGMQKVLNARIDRQHDMIQEIETRIAAYAAYITQRLRGGE